MTEALYNKMLVYARGVLYKGGGQLDEYDLVNEAYLRCGGDISEGNFRAKIKGVFLGELPNKSLSFIEAGKLRSQVDSDIQCKKCHEVKPAAFFRLVQDRAIQYYRSSCIKCETKWEKEYYHNNENHKAKKKEGALSYYYTNKEVCLERNRQYKKENPDKANKGRKEYMKEWHKKNKTKKPKPEPRINPVAFLPLKKLEQLKQTLLKTA